ncbi:MAG: stage II sporulation protein M [Candidatus Eremiobacteraeota bacterium]|nr:stage II sporulation protein M [Candidatus Eremiobacteraeota bacterium]
MAATREAPVLKSQQFRREREASWDELEALVEQARAHGVRSFTPEQAERFPMLYRSVLSSLSVARAIALDRALVAYLDNLALRAYLTFYAPPRDPLAAAGRFLQHGFPAAVRTLHRHVAIAFVALVIGVVTGFVLVNGSESWFSTLVPSDLAGGRGAASTAADLVRDELAAPVGPNVLDGIANVLFSHNTLVALLTFGLGMLAGVPAVLLTIYQGAILGAFFALHVHRGLGLAFAGWVGIHGVTEIAAFTLFAAAGLRLGEILVFPGETSRTDAFALRSGPAAKVAVGAALMLALAAVLEGYFRAAVQSTDLRLTIATLSLVFWIVYFALAGRRWRA